MCVTAFLLQVQRAEKEAAAAAEAAGQAKPAAADKGKAPATAQVRLGASPVQAL